MNKSNQKPRSREKSARRAPSDRDSAPAVRPAAAVPAVVAGDAASADVATCAAVASPTGPSDAPRTASAGPASTGTHAPVERLGTDSTGTHDPTRNLRLEWIEAGSLTENPANWRRHPAEQVSALRDLLEDPEVGWAGACLFNERTGRLIDGHARKGVVDPGTPIPVLVGSWSEDAEAKILATLDPVAALAAGDRSAYEALIEHVQTDSLDVRDLLDRTLAGIGRGDGADDADDDAAAGPEMPEMDLRPFEHYDYVIVLATNSLDWEALCEALSLERVNSSPIPGKRKIGLCRAIPATKLLTLLGRTGASPAGRSHAMEPGGMVTAPTTGPVGMPTRSRSAAPATAAGVPQSGGSVERDSAAPPTPADPMPTNPSSRGA